MANIVPGFENLGRVDRSVCRTTVRDLEITSHEMAVTLDPDTIIRRLGERAARDRNVRHRVRRFFLLCGRPTFVLPLPPRNTDTAAMLSMRHLTDAQRQWLDSLSLDAFPSKFRRRVVAAVVLLGVKSSAEVHAYPLADVCHWITAHRNPRTIVTAVAQLFRLVNRPDPMTMNVVGRHVNDGGLHLTADERRWLDAHPDAVVAYTTTKRTLTLAAGTRHIRTQQAVAIARRIMESLPATTPCAQWMDACCVEPVRLIRATVSTVVDAMEHHPLSLTQRGRQTRRTNVAQGEPGMDLSVAYTRSAQFLISTVLVPHCMRTNVGNEDDDTQTPIHSAILFWDIHLKPKPLWRTVRQQSDRGVTLMPVHDALSLAEMDRALGACQTPRERIVILLLSRLGMRIGAVCNLRLSGMLIGFDSVQPNDRASSWQIRRFISGMDKGARVNEWDLCFDPSVHAELESYVNAVWRPRYAFWVQRDARLRLVNGFLFPSHYVSGHAERAMSVHTLSQMVKGVLNRAGVTGPHAHCHGFRKGLVTELLRAGNPLYAVSRFVHHQSTAVTETSYDKRSYEEIVDRMILPLQWERQHPEVIITPPDDDQQQSNLPPPSLAGTMEQAVCALREEMENNDVLTRQWLIMRAMLPSEALVQYTEACRQNGIPEIPRTVMG